MILNWLKRILGIMPIPSSSNKEDGDKVSLSKSYEELDARSRTVQEEKKRIEISSVDWYNVSVSKSDKEKRNLIYQAYKFSDILSLKALKKERLKKEADELKRLEKEVQVILSEIESLIERRNAESAKHKFEKIYDKIVKVKDSSILQKYHSLKSSFNKLNIELERERLTRLAEEQRCKDEELKRLREAEEKARRAREKKEQEEKEKREAEAERLMEIARKKEDAERQEKRRLDALSSDLKDDWKSFKDILDKNGVKYLYHFTDRRNIASIKRHGGLLSWYYCRKHDIHIPCQGGDFESQELDKKYGLEDYVRLSFCDDHPMAYRLKQSGSDIVVLKIKVDVALLKDVQFSDMNAADKRHTHGKTLEHLKMVDFEATNMRFLRSCDPNFKKHQAEVMIKTFVPLKYIVNI